VTARVLVSLECAGNTNQPGALALVQLDPPALLAMRMMHGPGPQWLGGYARGLLRLPEGGLLASGCHRILHIDPASFEIRRTYTSWRFEDLHGMAWYRGQPLVVSTWRREVLSLDLDSGSVEPMFSFDDGVFRHPNSLFVTDDDRLLLSCHGGKGFGSVWQIAPGPAKIVLESFDGDPLRMLHDPVRTEHGIMVCESARGRVIREDGWQKSLGGWCRGLLETRHGVLVGINPFLDPVACAQVHSPQLALLHDSGELSTVDLGVGGPWQTFSVIPAEEGDLGR